LHHQIITIKKSKIMKVGDKIKLEDYGTLRTYTLVKKNYDGSFNLQASGTISFDASIEFINENKK
jgi:hypothetical protein